MALFHECMQSCAHIVLDTADIVRDGELSPTILLRYRQLHGFHRLALASRLPLL
jgi:hypothetical protein